MNTKISVINVLIYVIDDNEIILNEVRDAFKRAGILNVKFFTCQDELYAALMDRVQICIIDFYLANVTGLEVMKRVLSSNPYCLPIIMTSQSDPDVIIDLYDNGAFGYVPKDKPGFLDKLIWYIQKATDKINNQFAIFRDVQEMSGTLQLLFKTCNTDLNGTFERIDNTSSQMAG